MARYASTLFNASLLLLLLTINKEILSQGTNHEFEKIQIGDAQNMLAWLALHPDNNTIAVSSIQSFPLYVFNWEKKELEKQFNVGNWYAGSRASFSKSGQYVLLQQLFYVDWSFNKDKQVNFEVFDAETGASMLNFGNYHDAKITPDEQYLVTLSGSGKVFTKVKTL